MPYVALKSFPWHGRRVNPGDLCPKDQELAPGAMHRRRHLWAHVEEGQTVERLGRGRWRAVSIAPAPDDTESQQESPPPAPTSVELGTPTPALETVPEAVESNAEPDPITEAPTSVELGTPKKKSGKKR